MSGLMEPEKTLMGHTTRKTYLKGKPMTFGRPRTLKDRVFFYVLGSNVGSEFEAYGKLGGLAYFGDNSTTFWGAKIDAYITDDHHIEYTAFTDERDLKEFPYLYTYEEDDDGSVRDALGDGFGQTTYRRGGDNWIATYTGRFGDRVELL